MMTTSTVHLSATAQRYPRVGGLCLLLLLAVVLRIYFHPGKLGSMDRTAATPAMQITAGEFTPGGFASYRYGLIYPIAFSFSLFGANLTSLTLYSLLCSLGSIMLAFAIGARFGGFSVGLGAVFALAVLPLDIILAGRAYPDGPQAFFAILGLWLLLAAQERRGPKMLLAGIAVGVALGISCLCKVTTLFLLPALCVYAFFQKDARRPLCAALLGLAMVFIGEMALDYSLTGNALARVGSVTGLGQREPKTVGYSSSAAHLFPKKFFVTPQMYGLHIYAAVLAIIFLGWRHRGRYLLLLLWSLWFFGWTWLGTTSLSSYKPMSQLARYLAIINVPLAVLTALWFTEFRPRLRWAAYGVIGIAGLFMANLNLADSEETLGIRRVARQLQQSTDEFPVYANVRTDKALQFFLGDDGDRQVIAYGTTANRAGIVEGLSAVENAYILVDHNRIRASKKRYPNEEYPPEVFSPPPHWEEVLVVNNPARKSCYVQLRALRWMAQLPIAPSRLSRKVTGTIDETLQQRDVVLYFANSHAEREAPDEH